MNLSRLTKLIHHYPQVAIIIGYFRPDLRVYVHMHAYGSVSGLAVMWWGIEY